MAVQPRRQGGGRVTDSYDKRFYTYSDVDLIVRHIRWGKGHDMTLIEAIQDLDTMGRLSRGHHESELVDRAMRRLGILSSLCPPHVMDRYRQLARQVDAEAGHEARPNPTGPRRW